MGSLYEYRLQAEVLSRLSAAADQPWLAAESCDRTGTAAEAAYELPPEGGTHTRTAARNHTP